MSGWRLDVGIALVLFMLALGLRLFYQSESVTNRPLRADALKYASTAYNLRTHGLFAVDRIGTPNPRMSAKAASVPPGYPVFLSWFALFPGYPRSAQVAQALLSAATVWLLFLLGRRLHSERAGLIAAAFVYDLLEARLEWREFFFVELPDDEVIGASALRPPLFRQNASARSVGDHPASATATEGD